jgi:hypothetical protein
MALGARFLAAAGRYTPYHMTRWATYAPHQTFQCYSSSAIEPTRIVAPTDASYASRDQLRHVLPYSYEIADYRHRSFDTRNAVVRYTVRSQLHLKSWPRAHRVCWSASAPSVASRLHATWKGMLTRTHLPFPVTLADPLTPSALAGPSHQQSHPPTLPQPLRHLPRAGVPFQQQRQPEGPVRALPDRQDQGGPHPRGPGCLCC